MLGRLYIEKFLFIRDVEIEFSEGLNVITGETGTGKSMTLSAIEFVMGKQGDYEDGTAVEIEIVNGDETTILRREVKKGRSRYYLNGRGSSKEVVKEILENEVSLQGQNEFINLLKEEFQLKLLDKFSNLEGKLKELEEKFQRWKEKESELKDFERRIKELIEKKDYIEFRIKEIEEIGIKKEEYEELLKKEEALRNAEKIKKALTEVYLLLYEGESSVYENLGNSIKAISKIENYSEDYRNSLEKLLRIKEEIYEIYNELKEKDIELSEEEIDKLNEKIFKIQRVEEKYKKSFPEVIDEVNALKEELSKLEDIDLYKENLKEEVKSLKEEYLKLANEISEIRKRKAKELERKVKELLNELNLERAELKVSIEKGDYTKWGYDKVKFLFSSYGKDFKELGSSASGGELSRLFLALSLILPASKTYIFDEVDTGISGETSLKLARFLKELSKSMQIIVITHSAPLCAAGEKNFKTEKRYLKDIPYIVVKELSESEKLEEVARLMGIKTDETLKGASELIKLLS